MENLYKAQVDFLRSELLTEVEALPWKPQELETTSEIASFLPYLFREMMNQDLEETPISGVHYLFTKIVAGLNVLEEDAFAERYFAGYYLAAGLMMLEDAGNAFKQKNLPLTMLLCNSIEYFIGMIKGFRCAREIGTENYNKAASKKAHEARYEPRRRLLEQAKSVVKGKWVNDGEAMLHPKMRMFLQKYKDEKGTQPFAEVPLSTLNRVVKDVAIEIGRPELIFNRISKK